MNKIARSNSKKDVPSVQLAHERAWQPRGGSNENAFKKATRGGPSFPASPQLEIWPVHWNSPGAYGLVVSST
jgi:hypothetical protein